MRTVTLYECEICGRQHTTPESAASCEARGRVLDADVPEGLLIASSLTGMELVQAVAEVTPEKHRADHYATPNYYTWRDKAVEGQPDRPSPIGDSFPEMTTGPTLSRANLNYMAEHGIDTSTPRYARAYRDLTAAGISPTVWIDGRAVPAPEPRAEVTP